MTRNAGNLILMIGALALLSAPAPVQAADNPFSYMLGLNDGDCLKYNGEYYFAGNRLRGGIIASRDLRSWGRRTHVFSWNNTWHTRVNDPADRDKDIHGTQIFYDNGTFHLYPHLFGNYPPSGIVHAVGSSMMGTYTEPVTTSPFAELIDADLFKDENGSLYFYSTRIVSGEERICYKTATAHWMFYG